MKNKERLSFIGLALSVMLLGLFSFGVHILDVNNLKNNIDDISEPNKNLPLGITRLEALGVDNKKTLQLTVSPVDATIGDVTWVSNNASVVVTVDEEDPLKASVYATAGLPADAPATITATESISGVSASGYVYVHNKTELTMFSAGAQSFYVRVNYFNGEDHVVKMHQDAPQSNGHFFPGIRVEHTSGSPFISATIDIGFIGSEAPRLKYDAYDGEGERIITASNKRYPTNASVASFATYNVTLGPGNPEQGYYPQTFYIMTPVYANGPNTYWKNGEQLADFTVKAVRLVDGMNMGDVSIFE